MTDLSLKEVIEKIGGVNEAALACGVSPRAIYKWLKLGRLPRTDYTGETSYAKKLSEKAKISGIKINPESLLKKAA